MITIYGHSRCGWCIKAKNLAEQYKLSYVYKDTDDMGILNELKLKLPSAKTVPQIWWSERHLGGYESFASEIENTMSNYGQQEF